MSPTRNWLRLLVTTLIAMAEAHAADARPRWLVPPDQSVAGQSQAEWSRAWWQWAGSFPVDESPIADRTGALCGSRQNGAVWFLAGTYGTKRTIRQCNVPQGKFLFFPLINYVVRPRPGWTTRCDSVTRSAARMTDDVSALILEVDGVRVYGLISHRQATPRCFGMGSLVDGKSAIFPAAANGYYVMLRPLAKGRHTVNFGGALSTMLQAVTYTIDVR